MKRHVSFILVLLLLALVMTSCQDGISSVDEPATLPLSYFDTNPLYENLLSRIAPDQVPAGSSGEDVLATALLESYPSAANISIVLYRADGRSHSFYYSDTFVYERLTEDGSWETVPYLVLDVGTAESDTKWKQAENGVAFVTVNRENIVWDKIPSGRYRVIAFVGKEPVAVCAYFNIK